MKFNSILFTVLVLLGGCGEPNLDDAETTDKILAEALDADKLQELPLDTINTQHQIM